jgi:hypothetical protein
MFNWPQYINQTKNKSVRTLLVQALEYVKNREVALDLGAGALNESKYLLDSGFKKVIAVDSEEDSEIIQAIKNEAFIFLKNKIEDYEFPENYFNLINAQFALPFIAKEKINEVSEKIKKSLKVGGIFTGQFFGEKDSWAGRDGVAVYDEVEVRDLLSGLDIIYWQEEEKDGKTANNDAKHWHIFHFITQK